MFWLHVQTGDDPLPLGLSWQYTGNATLEFPVIAISQLAVQSEQFVNLPGMRDVVHRVVGAGVEHGEVIFVEPEAVLKVPVHDHLGDEGGTVGSAHVLPGGDQFFAGHRRPSLASRISTRFLSSSHCSLVCW